MCENQPGAPEAGVEPGRHVVLMTRPVGEGDWTAGLVRGRGLVPVAAPLLRVRVGRLAAFGVVDAVVVTSGNAVPGLAGVAGPVFAVGDATAARARAAGLGPVESASGDASALLALVRRRVAPGGRLLLATGAGQGFGLAAGLRGAGFRVRRRTVYRAVGVGRLPAAAGAALAGGRVRAVLFLSAETAGVFVRVLPAALRPALAGVEALAISAAVAAVLAPLPWRRVRVSLSPTLDQVVALL